MKDRISRRSFIKAAGLTAGTVAAAPILYACGSSINPDCGAVPCAGNNLPNIVPQTAATAVSQITGEQVFLMNPDYFNGAERLKDIVNTLEDVGGYVNYTDSATGKETELPYLLLDETDPGFQSDTIYSVAEAALAAGKTVVLEVGPLYTLTPVDTSGRDKLIIAMDLDLHGWEEVMSDSSHHYLEGGTLKPVNNMGLVLGFKGDVKNLDLDTIRFNRVQMFGPQLDDFTNPHPDTVSKVADLVLPGGDMIIVYGEILTELEKSEVDRALMILEAKGYSASLRRERLDWISNITGGARDSAFLPREGKEAWTIYATKPQQ